MSLLAKYEEPGRQMIALIHAIKYEDGHWEEIAWPTVAAGNAFVERVKLAHLMGEMEDIVAIKPREPFLSIQ